MATHGETFQKLVHVNRTTKVVKGGRRFSFSAIVIAGDQNGRVGMGTGKANEVLEANEKARNEAVRCMIKIELRDGRTIHHDSIGKYGSGYVLLKAAVPGTGIIAGGPLRSLFMALGVQDIVAKSIGSSNPHNMIKAAIVALKRIKSPKQIAAMRGIPTGVLIKRLKDARRGAPSADESIAVEA